MTRIFTADDVARIKLDGPASFTRYVTESVQVQSSLEHPCLTREMRIPHSLWRRTIVQVFVDGVPVPDAPAAVAAALAAYYARVAEVAS